MRFTGDQIHKSMQVILEWGRQITLDSNLSSSEDTIVSLSHSVSQKETVKKYQHLT